MAQLEIERPTVAAVLRLAALDKHNWEEALEQILRIDSQLLAVDRVSYWRLAEQPLSLTCELGYVRSDDALERGALLTQESGGSYLAELTRARVISIEDAESDPRAVDLRAYLSARRIYSMLDVPVCVESKLVGVLCHEHVDSVRRWSAEEVQFTVALAQIIANALEVRRRDLAEQEQLRDRFLASASLEMGESLDEALVVERAVRAAVPALADWAALDEFDGASVRRVAFAHADRDKQPLLERYVAAFPPAPDAPHLTVVAHELKEAVVIPEVTDERLRNHGFSDAHIDLLRGLGLRSAIAVPLVVYESIDAVLMLISKSRTYDYEALRLAEAYGQRVASTWCNARLYRRSQAALRARDDFLALAAHELRTPLTSLRVSCERLEALTERAQPDLAEIGRRVLRQSRRLTKLVNRMLDVSHSDGDVHVAPQLSRERVQLANLVRELVEEAAAAKIGTPIEVVLPDVLYGEWDASRLQEVIANLLDNAIKYGRNLPVRVALAVDGGDAVLTVADHGIGIEPEALPHIFEAYARGASSRGYGGLGLGLFVVKRIVEAHGGTLEVQSEPGSGSIFTVRLPGAQLLQ